MDLWRRLDRPGHEAARLIPQGTGWRLDGTAVFAYEDLPVRLDYQIVLDAARETQSTRVSGWVGQETVTYDILVDADRQWTLNGVVVP